MRCERCRITFTTKQVDNRCPMCKEELMETKTVTGQVADVMEKKNKNGELFWNAKINGKSYNFNEKPDTGTSIEANYTENTWNDASGNPVTSRWVQGFKAVEQAPFQQATQVTQTQTSPDVMGLMYEALSNAIEITENINAERAESKMKSIEWTTEDIRTIANSMYIQKFKTLGFR